jgi:HK97 family phage portal protein
MGFLQSLFTRGGPPPAVTDAEVEKAWSQFKTMPEPEQKSFVQETATNYWQFYFGQSSNKQYSPAQLLEYNTGYIYACNEKVAATLASIPIKLYWRGSSEPKVTAHRSVSKAFKKRLQARCNKEYGEIVEITESPIKKLLTKVNQRMSWTDMSKLCLSYKGLLGNAYIWKEKDKDGRTAALKPLRSECMSAVVQDSDIGWGDIKAYKFHNNSDSQASDRQKVVEFPVEDVIHIRDFQPGNMLYGRGELEACLAAAERQLYYDQTENYLNRNFARPDFMVIYKNGLKETEQKELFRQWYKRYGTPQNAGKPMIVGGDVEVKNINFSPRDMQYALGREDMRKTICSVFGVPEALIVINDANLASAKSAMDHFMRFTIMPKLRNYMDCLTAQWVQEYDEGLFLDTDIDVTSEDPMEQAQVDNIYMAAGVYDSHWVRSRLGIEEQYAAEMKEEEEEPEAEKPAVPPTEGAKE